MCTRCPQVQRINYLDLVKYSDGNDQEEEEERYQDVFNDFNSNSKEDDAAGFSDEQESF